MPMVPTAHRQALLSHGDVPCGGQDRGSGAAFSDRTGRLDIGKRKTSYLLAGERPGGAKLKKASMFGTKLIDAKGLKDLIAGEVPAAASIGILSSGFEGNAINRTRVPGALDEDVGDKWNLLYWVDR